MKDQRSDLCLTPRGCADNRPGSVERSSLGWL
jgi:hypothetical protein